MARRKKSVSICRIAEEAGVSAATVSRVINRRVGVGEETRRKINRLLRHYDFSPVYPAVRSVKIAVVVGGGDMNEHIREALKGIYAYANAHELSINIITVNSPRRESLLETIRDQQCSGVIAILAGRQLKAVYELTETDLPVVVVDSQLDEPGVGFVDNDSYSGSVEATRHLIGLGHRRIGYLQHCIPSLNQVQRFRGYENTMKLAGLAIDEKWVIQAPPQPGGTIRGMPGLLAMRQLLDQAPELTAVLAVDDDMAMGAMSAIHERGLRIPQDISLVGFDNCPESQVWYPPLTTVENPVEQAGFQAAESIHAALTNPGGWTPPREILPTRLIVRKSTGPVKK
jgi:DNA-binding LacI/PurR family transcriptional regulator